MKMSRTVSLAMVVFAMCATYAQAHDLTTQSNTVAIHAQASSPKAQSSTVAFVHAAVVPMDRERVLPDQTVVVIDGRIAALGPASKVKVPRGAVRIDAKL